MKEVSLKSHEWGAVISYIALLLVIALYTLIYIPWKYPAVKEDPHWLLDPYIEVYISGAVKNPGLYRMPRGSTRGDLLTKAEPSQKVDLRRLKTSAKLKQGELVELTEIELITVSVAGEVENPCLITVPKGTKVFEIQGEVVLSSSGDERCLQRRRTLKNGETLVIKKKKS